MIALSLWFRLASERFGGKAREVGGTPRSESSESVDSAEGVHAMCLEVGNSSSESLSSSIGRWKYEVAAKKVNSNGQSTNKYEHTRAEDVGEHAAWRRFMERWLFLDIRCSPNQL